MFKVLIADDDMIGRVGIKMIGKWEDYEMEIIGEASDGRQALELFQQYRPQLIITDIRMPDMDGMELLKSIRQTDTRARVLMLTNYDDKEYIKEAVRLGANDFITKNEIDEESFEKILKREQEELKKVFQDRERSGQDDELLKMRQFVKELLGMITEETYIEKEFCKIFLKNSSNEFRSAMFHITCKRYGKDGKRKHTALQLGKFSQIVSGVVAAYPHSIISENKGVSLTVFFFDEGNYMQDTRFRELIRSVKNALTLYTAEEIHIGVSKLIDCTQDLKDLKFQADRAVMGASFFSENKVVFFKDMDELELNQTLRKRHIGMLKKIYMSELNCLEDIKNICRMILDDIEREQNIGLKWMFCNEFASWYNRITGMMHLNEKLHIREYLDSQLLLNAFDLSELSGYVTKYIQKIEQLKQEDQRTGNSVIDEALYYIKINYASPISLSDVSDYVHLSKNYFSSLFSESAGMTFVDYLTNFRIQKAAEILCVTDYQIQDVAELTGFSSERYFSQTFKSVMGISPSDYRSLERSGFQS